MLVHEIAERLHSEYVKDDYIQVMLPYKKYAQIYGNGGLMFYQYLLKDIKYDGRETAIVDIDKMNKYVNEYVTDKRNVEFPYSGIPFHSERVGLFSRRNFTNQILDYEKPYIKINDGFITKVVAYKDSEGAIVHTEVLNNISTITGKSTLTRKELEEYLRTGRSSFDPTHYEFIQICDLKGGLYDISLQPEEYYMDLTRKEIQRNLSPYTYEERTANMLNKMVWNLNESFAYVVLFPKKMIKITKDGDIIIENFSVVRTDKDKYEVNHSRVPFKVEDLNEIKRRLGSTGIETVKEPKIKNKMVLRKKELQLD